MKRSLLTTAVIAGIAGVVGATGPVFAAADGGGARAVDPQRSVMRVSALANGEAELIIYGFIGDTYYGEGNLASTIVTQLGQINASTIQIRINSPGGSVPDGLAIYNALRRHPARKVVTVDGEASSIASLIVQAGDERIMPDNTLQMMHAPSAFVAGNAVDLRDYADQLDTWATAIMASYLAKAPGKAAELKAILTDGKDHYFTAEEAVAFGIADKVLSAAPAEAPDEAAATAALLGYIDAITKAPAPIAARLRRHIASAAKPQIFASLPEANQRAVIAHIEDPIMRANLLSAALVMANAAGAAASAGQQSAAAAAPPPSVPPGSVTPTPVAAVDASAITAQAQAALKTRNDAIVAALKPLIHVKAIAELQTAALTDPTMSADVVNQKALAIMAAHASPTGSDPGRVEAGADQRDKDRDAMTNYVLARCAAVAKKGEDGKPIIKFESIDASNPFRGNSLTELAEHNLRASGVNTARMTRGEIAARAMVRPMAAAGHTTSDFPNLLENILNKLLVAAYKGAPVTWPRFCRTTDLNDFREHPRYRIGTFADLKETNEAGNYEQGSVADAERESITGKRKGRLLVITREMIVNDDLQAITDIASGLGRVAMRTIEKDVFALFALNGGAGPTMGDGKALFHVDHNNIAAVAAAPSMASFDAGRVAMAKQKDPSGNDFLDIRPSIWLGPMELGGLARSINRSQYDPDAANKLQKPNIVLNLFNDMVDTPRLSSTPWYMLADSAEEPVFEVGFIGGQREPTVEQDRDFTSDGMRWKTVLEYGTNATGWRGIQKNAGA
jgi:ATP-dependent protease ClpP protease subunit